MRTTYAKLDLPVEDNFLVKPYSEEHGEGYILTDDPIQEAVGFLFHYVPDEEGMVVVIKGDEIAIAIKTDGMEDGLFGRMDFGECGFSEAGEIYRAQNLHHVGVLIDLGVNGDGEHKLRIVSDYLYDPTYDD